MTVYLVGAGPGDPGLLTRRGADLLSRADVVVYDRLVHHALVGLAPDGAELIDVGKRPGAPPPGADRQEEINRLLVRHGRRSQTVIRLKGGDPFLFGRGGEEAQVLTEAGVPWQVVPGVSSALAVPAAAGVPVTHRGLASSVTVVTGRVGDPAAPGGVDWEALARVGGTLVILMGMTTRAEIAAALQRGGKTPDTPTAVIERGTTADQRVVRTTLDRLAEVDLGAPAVIVVGPVAALGAGGRASTGGPLSGRAVVVTRSGPRARGLVDALGGAGAEAIEVGLTGVADPTDGGAALREALADVQRCRWVVLTSVNAVDRVMGSLRDARELSRSGVAAVGPATARALRAAGVEPDLVPAEHRAEGLVAAFPEADRASGATRVLFPGADQAPSTIPDGLAAKGWDVHQVVAYRTVVLPPPAPERLAGLAAADAVVLTAPSSARALVALRGPDGGPLAVPPLAVCIGPTTAAAARALGWRRVREAADPTPEGIVAALVRHLGESPPHGP
ncbi:MAG: uroporphyrinogen-III C-methyltransferase [Acidimicrobiales bacterium]